MSITNHAPIDWTVMVYLCADNNLEPNAYDDLNEMEAADDAADLMDIVALIDRTPGYTTEDGNWTSTRLYKINPDNDMNTFSSTRLASTELGLTINGDEELNMADPSNLEAFIDFCIANYPSGNYLLIFWNHGDGWKSYPDRDSATKGICQDSTSSDDILHIGEVASVISNRGIDAVGFDACYMGMAEVLYELKGSADYVIASPDEEPAAGWEYRLWSIYFANSSRSLGDLAHAIIRSYSETYYYLSRATLSAYDMSAVQSLADAIDLYATTLLSRTNTWWDDWGTGYSNYAKADFDAIRNQVQTYTTYGNVDAYHIAELLPLSGATELKSAINDLIAEEWHQSNGHLNGHGLSIYFDSPIETDTYNYVNSYTNINRFNQNSVWTDYLRAYYDFPPYTFITTNTNYSDTLENGESAYYQFFVQSPGNVSINLTVPPNSDDDLYLYRYNVLKHQSMLMGVDTDESLTNISLDQNGWYIIRVKRFTSDVDNESFSLQISNISAGIY